MNFVDRQVSVVYAPICLAIAAGKHHGVKSLTGEYEFDEMIIAPVDHQQVHRIAQWSSKGA